MSTSSFDTTSSGACIESTGTPTSTTSTFILAMNFATVPPRLAIDSKNYNLMNDAVFKFVFGKVERKAILIDLLNTFLADDLGHKIRDLTYGQQETSPTEATGKEIRFDVACTLDSGENVDIEVQVLNQKNTVKRTLYYWARQYPKLQAGMDYMDLVPAITFNVLDFVLFPEDVAPHSAWGIYNRETMKRLTQDLSIHFLEIPKFSRNNALQKDFSKAERWMCYFSSKISMTKKREVLMSDHAIAGALNAVDAFFHDPVAQKAYLDREMIRMDIQSGLRASREEGRVEGRVEGRAEGREEGIEEGLEKGLSQSVRAILSQNYSFEETARLLKLPVDDVRRFAGNTIH